MICWNCERTHEDTETDFSLSIENDDDEAIMEISIVIDLYTVDYDLCYRCLKKIINGWLRRVIRKEG